MNSKINLEKFICHLMNDPCASSMHTAIYNALKDQDLTCDELNGQIDDIVHNKDVQELPPHMYNIGDMVDYCGDGYHHLYTITDVTHRGYYVSMGGVPNGIIPFNQDYRMTMIGFRKRDYVVYTEGGKNVTYEVVEVGDSAYKCREVGTNQTKTITFNNPYLKKWDIKYANDGDLINLGMCLVLFRNVENEDYAWCYCGYTDRDGFDAIDDNDHLYGIYHASPANDGQRKIFFEEMHKAGYEWDAENKQLIKMPDSSSATSDESADTTEFAKAIDNLLVVYDSVYHGGNVVGDRADYINRNVDGLMAIARKCIKEELENKLSEHYEGKYREVISKLV